MNKDLKLSFDSNLKIKLFFSQYLVQAVSEIIRPLRASPRPSLVKITFGRISRKKIGGLCLNPLPTRLNCFYIQGSSISQITEPVSAALLLLIVNPTPEIFDKILSAPVTPLSTLKKIKELDVVFASATVQLPPDITQ